MLMIGLTKLLRLSLFKNVDNPTNCGLIKNATIGFFNKLNDKPQNQLSTSTAKKLFGQRVFIYRWFRANQTK